MLPAVSLQAFSPAFESYVMLEGPEFEIEVLPGEGVAKAEPFGEEIPQVEASVSRDILPLRASASLSSDRLESFWWLFGIGGIPLLVVLGSVLSKRIGSVERKVDPKRELKKRLRKAATLDGAKLEALFLDCAGYALNQAPAGIRRADLEGISNEALRRDALEVYRALEAARYGGGSGVELRRTVECMQGLLEATS